MAAVRRGVLFLGLWLVLAGPDPLGPAFGLPAAALAAWASLRLLPPSGRVLGRCRRSAWARKCCWPWSPPASTSPFARWTRAAACVPARSRCPSACRPARRATASGLLASLQPGTLPAGLDGAGRLVVHTLDTRLPVAAETRAAEALFAAAVGQEVRHG